MARGETTRGEQTRQAILRAAVDRFGRDGFRATSVADVARRADVSGSLVYAYFPNKEALFVAALDEDTAAVMQEGVSSLIADADLTDWREALIFTLLAAVRRHPLAERVLAGLEPGVTERVLEMPALNDLRKACTERLRREQLAGTVRADIDPAVIGNGIVTIVLSLLMSVVQIGGNVAVTYRADVVAVLEAALSAVPGGSPDARRTSRRRS